MAANVLNSTQAVRMSVFVVRAFVKLREVLATHNELAGHNELSGKLTELERKVGTHDLSIVAAIRGLTDQPKHKSRAIAFDQNEKRRRTRSQRNSSDVKRKATDLLKKSSNAR